MKCTLGLELANHTQEKTVAMLYLSVTAEVAKFKDLKFKLLMRYVDTNHLTGIVCGVSIATQGSTVRQTIELQTYG